MNKLHSFAFIIFNIRQTADSINIFNRTGACLKKSIKFFLFFTLLTSYTKSFADVTLTTSPLAAANINQGTNSNIVYVTNMSVATEPVAVNNIQFTLTGTFDANDLSLVTIYFNATAPTISGATGLTNTVAAFASGHAYSINFFNAMAAGTSGYYIIAVNVNGSATDNHTVKINGATGAVVFGFSTSPDINNNQTDAAGLQTIQAADITLTTSPLAAANINQGTNSNIVYVTNMSVSTEPVAVNNIQFTLTGTFDANDLSLITIYFNPTAPTISGATGLTNTVAAFASGHAYSINFFNAMAAGTSGYYIIAVNVNGSATDNHTVKINGATGAVVFGFSTSPNINNNQTDAAGLQTIQAADITLTTSPLAAANINQGTNSNIVYVTNMSVSTEPVAVNNIQFTLTGTFDANDLSLVTIYFNAYSSNDIRSHGADQYSSGLCLRPCV